MCECVCCELSFRQYWDYMKHLVEKHGYGEGEAKTLVIDMITWAV